MEKSKKKFKFRGKLHKSGLTVTFGFSALEFDLYLSKYDDFLDEDSIDLFVATDQNGKEVYTGDILVGEYNGIRYEYKVTVKGFATTEDGCYIAQSKFKNFKLKEDSTNEENQAKTN